MGPGLDCRQGDWVTNSLLSNQLLVHWSVIVKQPHTTRQCPTPFLLDSMTYRSLRYRRRNHWRACSGLSRSAVQEHGFGIGAAPPFVRLSVSHWPASVSSWKQHFSKHPTHNICTVLLQQFTVIVSLILCTFIHKQVLCETNVSCQLQRSDVIMRAIISTAVFDLKDCYILLIATC